MELLELEQMKPEIAEIRENLMKMGDSL